MEITCPRCETVFSLPDNLFVPGKKARCTNCGMIFPMQAAAGAAAVGAKAPGKTSLKGKIRISRTMAVILASLVLLCLLGAAGWWAYSSFFGSSGQTARTGADQEQQSVREERADATEQGREEAPSAQDLEAPGPPMISDISIVEGLRQFPVNNIFLGPMVVIEGHVRNDSKEHKANIEVEAWLTDRQNNILARQRQLCGITLPYYQLQTLDEKRLMESLNNRVELVGNNSDVPPGTQIPFTVVFTEIPQNLYRYYVIVTRAEPVPEKGGR